jgi:hypothetical protein
MQQPVDGVTMDRMLYSSASTTGSSQGYHCEMLPRTDNLDNHSFTHHDIARMFDDRTVVTGISRTLFDSVPFNEPSTNYSAAFTEPTFHSSFASIEANNLEDNSFLETFTSEALYTNNLSEKEADELCFAAIPSSEVNFNKYTEGSIKHPLLKQLSLDLFKPECAGLKKHDSFSKWMSKELPEVVDLDMKSNSDAYWSSIETVSVTDGSVAPTNEQLDVYAVSPSLSPNQLFSILDVSPSCTYIGQNTKVCKLI